MLRKFSKKAQTTAEYAILIALVIAAVTAMQIYVKRGIQGQVRDSVIDMGSGMGFAEQGITTDTKQYEPYYLSTNTDTKQNSNGWEATATGGVVTRNTLASTNVTRNQDVSAPPVVP